LKKLKKIEDEKREKARLLDENMDLNFEKVKKLEKVMGRSYH